MFSGLSNTMGRMALEPALVGGIASVASLIFMDGYDSVPTLLGNMPAFIPLGIGVAGASYISEFIKGKIIPQNNTSQVLASATKPVLTGLASLGTMTVLNSFNLPNDLMTPFILGAVRL